MVECGIMLLCVLLFAAGVLFDRRYRARMRAMEQADAIAFRQALEEIARKGRR